MVWPGVLKRFRLVPFSFIYMTGVSYFRARTRLRPFDRGKAPKALDREASDLIVYACTMQGTSLEVENGIIDRPKKDKGTAAPHLSHVAASHRQGPLLTNSRSLPGTSLIVQICGCVVCVACPTARWGGFPMRKSGCLVPIHQLCTSRGTSNPDMHLILLHASRAHCIRSRQPTLFPNKAVVVFMNDTVTARWATYRDISNRRRCANPQANLTRLGTTGCAFPAAPWTIVRAWLFPSADWVDVHPIGVFDHFLLSSHACPGFW